MRPSARRTYSVGRSIGRSGRHTNQHVVSPTSSHQIDRTARKRLERRAVHFLSSPFLSSASQLFLLIHIVHSLLFSSLVFSCTHLSERKESTRMRTDEKHSTVASPFSLFTFDTHVDRTAALEIAERMSETKQKALDVNQI